MDEMKKIEQVFQVVSQNKKMEIVKVWPIIYGYGSELECLRLYPFFGKFSISVRKTHKDERQKYNKKWCFVFNCENFDYDKFMKIELIT